MFGFVSQSWAEVSGHGGAAGDGEVLVLDIELVMDVSDVELDPKKELSVVEVEDDDKAPETLVDIDIEEDAEVDVTLRVPELVTLMLSG